MLHAEQSLVASVLEDWETAPVPDRTRAALRLLHTLTLDPMAQDRAFVAGLRADGLSTEDIEEAAAVGFQFNLINRAADALDFPVPNAQQLPKVARILDLSGKLRAKQCSGPSWRRAADGHIRPVELDIAREHFFAAQGALTPETKRAVEGYVAALVGSQREGNANLPEVLTTYLHKVTRYAYRVLDEDIEALQQRYSDRAVVELTMAACFGAALARLEPLFAAMYGETH